ncbi:flagellin N-terminal helical domain-containing protein [Thiohalobacter sp.]|uniref:flagellin N-terminal helical domain-containing protein n=1 Tax=Thiohalobacter sp. TaxID=2025948 RepID=UPI00262F6DE6|nr:flagellin [Thiohalobacter sp.]
MPQVINTNVMSLNAQRNLTRSQTSLATSIQRLSSGLRINSAKDDAAGLAISERMSAQIRGLNQAARNANDAISLAQTAEGAMSSATDILQRIRELAIQSANSTNSASDRAALQEEVNQLVEELDRISTTTEFNGLKLLDGTFTAQQFQVGANANQTLSVSVDSMRTDDIGAYVNASSDQSYSAGTAAGAGGGFAATTLQSDAQNYTGVDGNAISGGNLQINGKPVNDSVDYVGANLTYQGDTSAYAKARAINDSNIAGVTAVADNTQTFAEASADNFLDASGITFGATDTLSYTLTINGEQIFSGTTLDGTTNTISMQAAVDAINSKQFDTGITATITSAGALQLQADDGRDIVVSETIAFNDNTTAAGSSGTLATVFSSNPLAAETAGDDSGSVTQNLTFKGQVTLQSSDNITFNSGQALLGFGSATVSATGSISAVDISDVSGANAAILAVDAALDTINSSRARLGAVQNRVETTIANLQTTSENLSAARSRIRDTDFAAETANMTRMQILQQAGVAMLAQANAVPQLALQLLQ